MKNKKGFWSGRLFLDGMKQLKWVGLIGLAVMFLLYVITYFMSASVDTVSSIATYSNTMEMASSYMIRHSYNYLGLFAGNFSSMIYMLLVPVMMFRLFGFMNRRAGSDFYHAAPKKRINLFLSYASAVLAWACIIQVILLIIEILLTLFFVSGLSDSYIVTYSDVWVWLGQFLTTLAGSLLVIGAVSVAMALTGNLMTNVIASLIILCAPRLIIGVIVNSYYDMLPILSATETVSDIVNPAYQLFYSFFDGFGYLSYSYVGYAAEEGFSLDTGVIAIIYSSVLGILYLILGARLFCRRKSEVAGRASINGVFQCLLRLTVSFVFCMIGVIQLVTVLLFTEKKEGAMALAVGWIVTGVIVYFLFELISTRKLKMVAKSAAQLPVLAVVSVLLGVVFFNTAQSVIDDVPALEEIKSVRIVEKNYYDSNYYSPTSDEVQELVNQIEMTSKDARKLVASNLAQQMAYFKRKGPDYGQQLFEHYNYDLYPAKVMVEKEDGTVTRTIYFSTNEYQVLNEEIAKAADEMTDVTITLPEISEKKLSENYGYIRCAACAWPFDYGELCELYECLKKELKETAAPLSVYMGRGYNKNNVFDFMEIFYEDGEDYYSTGFQAYDLPISVSTPKTVEKLASLGNAHWKNYDFDWFVDFVETKPETANATISFILYEKDGKNGLKCNEMSWDAYYIGMEPEDLKSLQELLSTHDEQEITMDENVLFVVYKNIEGVEFMGHWYNLTDEELNKFSGLVNTRWTFERYSYDY